MRHGNNVIENENVGTTNNFNNNNNVIDNKYQAGRTVERLADELMKKLGAEEKSRPFLCKAAWKLSEARIWQNVESALKGRNRMGLFIYLCKRDGV